VVNQETRTYPVELEGDSYQVPCRGYAFAAIQVIPDGYSSTTGVIELKRSLSDDPADAVSFSSAKTPNMTSKAILDTIDVRDVDYLYIHNTTADSGKRARVLIHLSEE